MSALLRRPSCRQIVSELDVLYEDNHLLAINKPAGLVTMGARPGTRTVLDVAKEYLKQKYDKPGNVYLGVVSRLDGPVTGVLLMARTSKAADRLNRQFRERDVEKSYWALVSGTINPQAGTLVDWMAEDERHRRMHAVRSDTPGAKEARLRYRLLETTADGCLVEIELETGRKHQIRVQLAKAGCPVLGDRKYGSCVPFEPGIALHARRLVFSHPVRDERIELVAPLPASWRKYGSWS